MLNVVIYAFGNLKESYLRDAIAEYSKRLTAFCDFKINEIGDRKPLPPLPPKAFKIALCVEGRQLSSEELAAEIEKLPVSGISEIDFIIGGENGLSEEDKKKCDLRLSFSKMTFPHQLMRVILCEQIYRAFTIINHGKYHK